jgi:hypothetical protein
MNVVGTIKRFRRRVVAPGSPFRYLRKGWLNLSNPAGVLGRARAARPLLETNDGWFPERIAQLEKDGFAFGGDEIDTRLLAELDAEATARRAASSSGTDILSFATEFIGANDFRPDSIFVRFALQPAVLKVACAYFGGRVPVLGGIQLLLSHGRNHTGRWLDSQLWHRDYNDARMLKFWVYLNDVVKEEDGPFTYLPLAESRKVPNNFFPGRVSDESIAKAGLAEKMVEVCGPRLKSFYIDTGRCYHLGSRLKEGHTRFAYLVTFVTHAPLYPNDTKCTLDGNLSEVERLVLTP